MSKITRDPLEAGVGEWASAYRRLGIQITSHPAFPRLVREVAVAEQSGHPGYGWLSRNSRTYASWMTRGMPARRKDRLDQRGQLLAEQIADDLGVWPTLPRSESVARVYGEARDHVRARLTGADDSP